MARDYGSRRQAKGRSNAPRQIVWVLASFLCGYLTATVFDFTSLSSWVNSQILAKKEQTKPEAQKATEQAQLPKPKFEFYTLLAKDRNASVPSHQPVQSRPLPQPAVNTVVASATTPTHTPAETKPLPAVSNATPVLSTPLPITNTSNKEVYQVQVASFNKRPDAERMKAALTLRGFNVNVTMVSQQGVNWFRVIIGPFNSRNSAEKAQIAIARSERTRGMIRRIA